MEIPDALAITKENPLSRIFPLHLREITGNTAMTVGNSDVTDENPLK